MEYQYIIPEHIRGEDIREVRERLGLTQKEFAQLCSVSQRSVERWETRDEAITGPIVTLVTALQQTPGLLNRLMLPENRLKRRLKYMYKSTLCAIIDVDDLNREVEVRNLIDLPAYRPFGSQEHPTYKAYQVFLESRCFAADSSDAAAKLKELGIPFYDPLLIIEKTGGRTEQDDFWIEITS